jgi:hypothetical protein
MCIAKTVKCYVVHQSKVKAKTRNRTILPCCQMFGTALGVFLSISFRLAMKKTDSVA